jgi:hypothetical protein
MFIGRGRLQDVVLELNRQRESRVDVILDGRTLAVNDKCRLVPVGPQAGEWLPTDGLPFKIEALKQLGQRLSPEVPGKFLETLASERGPLAGHLLTGLLQEPKRHFVRCLDGQVRAVLSNRYRVIDNYDVAFAALEAVRRNGGEALESRLSDKVMELTFTDRNTVERLEGVIKTGGRGNHRFVDLTKDEDGGGGGEIVHPYVRVRNSETGHGGFDVSVGIFRSMCVNGVVVESLASQIHLGETLDVGRWSDETRSAESKAVMLKLADAVASAFHPETFKRMILIANRAQADKIDAPSAAVDQLIANSDLPQESRDAILSYFLADYDASRYGLSQAVARFAQDTDDADRASEIESLAGKVLVGAV